MAHGKGLAGNDGFDGHTIRVLLGGGRGMRTQSESGAVCTLLNSKQIFVTVF